MPAVCGLLIMISLFIAVAWGWVSNIVNILSYETIEMSGVVLLQVIGVVVAPLGVVMGWMM